MPAFALAAKPRFRRWRISVMRRCRCQRIQCRGQFVLRRGVIDHDQPARAPQARQHAIEAGECVLGTAMHRHHHIDRGLPSRRGARHGREHRSHWDRRRRDRTWRGGRRQPDKAGPACLPRRPPASSSALGSSGLPSRSLPSRPSHMQQSAQSAQRSRRHGEAARPSQQAAVVDPHVGVGCGDRDPSASSRRTDRQYRIDVGIPRVPGPARQAAILARSHSRRPR